MPDADLLQCMHRAEASTSDQQVQIGLLCTADSALDSTGAQSGYQAALGLVWSSSAAP